MSDNSWYERKHLPPIGIECEYLWNGYPEEWRVVKITDSGFDFEIPCVSLRQGNQLRINSDASCFRPIKTDRELSIEEMAKVMRKGTVGTYMSVAEKLYDAGYRKNES